ncbi:MAG: hypothetical protein IPM34_11895 [Saprospiraceae bacterium]|nr:hypothetical protein [Saprospiraceae bacterium]
MQSYLLKFLTLVLIISFYGCNGDDPVITGSGRIELVFKGEYASLPWVKGQTYDYFNNGQILFTKSEFFISNLGLYQTGLFKSLSAVEYVSISEHHVSEQKALEGLVLQFDQVPEGSYDSLAFNLGLTAAQNKTKPADYLPTHPLGEGSRYWAGWNSYIFSKTEGNYNDGSKSFNFTYHSGFDDAMKPIHLVKNIVVEKDKTTRIIIHLDHQLVFSEGPQGMDISTTPQIHNKSTVMDAFMDRYQQAFRIE